MITKGDYDMERTYIMLKPDCIKRRLIGDVIKRIENKGFNITAMKMMQLDEAILREHYAHVKDEPFFPDLVRYMSDGHVIAMIVEGDNVIAGMRHIMGPTKYDEALAGTIRGDYATSTRYNVIHGSDSPENAEIEIRRFFK